MARKRQSPTFRRRIFEIMRNATEHDEASRLFDIALTVIIVINVLIVMFETVESLNQEYGYLFSMADNVIAVIFTIEYIVRIWSATSIKKYRHPFFGRLRFGLRPLPLIDLLSILPFYTPFFIALDINFLRALRLFRLIRVLKIYRYSDELQAFMRVLRLKKRQLSASLLIIIIGLLFSSTVIYFAEREAQPEYFGSIPASLWWATITMTTVGYGDVIPATATGRLLGGLVALLGVGVFAVPAGILASGYMRVSSEIARQKSDKKPSRSKKY